ncbi:VOC family protein [Pseudactinotalea sp. Z1739]|uniref:VOC family protein n=1 Tax=Pseudactinotalea sp. Z1739 TaxID=3413028 RepID=UPI003C7C823A
MSTHYLPDGFTTLSPLIVVTPASAAIDFYAAVFGAEVATRMDGPDGSVWHCELNMGHGRMTVMDPNGQFNTVANNPADDDVSFSLAIYLPDVDAVLLAARERGARVREEAADFEVTGDRFASIQDPFGVRWTIMTRMQERTDAQIQEGLDAWAASLATTPTAG